MSAVRFLDGKPDYDLTYNDVFMAPNRSSISSRTEVDLNSTEGVGTPLPIVVANMTAISGRRMAETMARRGGIVSPAEFEGIDRFTQVQEVMTTDLTLVGTDATPSEVFDRLSARHQKVALVAADDGSLLGLMTSKGALRSSMYDPALDPDGRLMVGTAIGINGDVAARARRLLDAVD